MTLRNCSLGREVVIRGIVGASACRRRLLEWGFVPGARVKTVARGPAGGVVVAVVDSRVALDAHTAGSLLVEPLAAEPDGRPAASSLPGVAGPARS